MAALRNVFLTKTRGLSTIAPNKLIFRSIHSYSLHNVGTSKALQLHNPVKLPAFTIHESRLGRRIFCTAKAETSESKFDAFTRSLREFFSQLKPSEVAKTIREMWQTRAGRLALMGNFAYFCYLLQNLMTNILYLRCFNLTGGFILVLYQALQPKHMRLMVPVYWNSIFVFVNIIQIGRLLHDRREIHLSPEEAVLFAQCFRKFSFQPFHFRKLIDAGYWEDYPQGSVLITQNSVNDHVYVVYEGELEVVIDGKIVSTLPAGSFVGEMTFLDDKVSIASATVRTTRDTRCFAWKQSDLRRVMEQNPTIKELHMLAISHDLMSKIKSDRRLGVLEHYRASLESALCDDTLSDATKATLMAQRARYGISLDEHWKMIESFGWSVHEFEQSFRDKYEEPDTKETKEKS